MGWGSTALTLLMWGTIGVGTLHNILEQDTPDSEQNTTTDPVGGWFYLHNMANQSIPKQSKARHIKVKQNKSNKRKVK